MLPFAPPAPAVHGRVRAPAVALLAALLGATAPSGAAAAEATLRVGTSGDYAPFSLAGRGFDVDVAERMAADLGVRLRWVRFAWPELADRVRAGDFDLVMSGVTWRPERAVLGWMSRAVAAGGPCLVGAAGPARLAVNRGGVLERWARARHPGREIVATDDNLALPELLASGRVDAFVTDSFELPHFARPGWPARCEPPIDRKVYWVVAGHGAERTEGGAALGRRIDDWLAVNEPELRELRARWLGGPAPRDDVDHLIDLLARRLALMPAVARWKRERGQPIEDPERETRVLAGARAAALEQGLDPDSVAHLFRVQIELARALQARAGEAPRLDLVGELRPALQRLGARIVRALARVAPLAADDLAPARLAPLTALLEPAEREALLRGLLGVRAAGTAPRGALVNPPWRTDNALGKG